MSRAYRIKVSERCTRTVHVQDGVETRIDLLDILCPEEMEEILRQQLEAGGFERKEDGTMVKQLDGEITIEINPQKRKLGARIGKDTDLEAEQEIEGQIYDDHATEGTQRLRDKAQQQADQQLNAMEQDLQRRVTQTLEQALEDVRAELDTAINRTTAQALKQRAGQLGEIEEISEDTETGSLRIRVRL